MNLAPDLPSPAIRAEKEKLTTGYLDEQQVPGYDMKDPSRQHISAAKGVQAAEDYTLDAIENLRIVG
ncbi:unnamed protein product [Heligmosomoides polygyrus]|uniref:Phytanoyl-CoA dioxygenase n=1 Tax=Heligmosomoides polygyrus TaxID=6339 RepID=A0A183FS17_HELPZ|nr:unnamed protein product [Heligmosomoides polygyrus]